MSLFLTLGAMAQEPVVTITPTGNAPYKVSDTDAAEIFNLDNLTVIVDVTTTTLDGRGAFFCVADPAQPVPSSFSGTGTSFMACGHVNAVSAYLAAAKDGQHFSTGAIPSNTANVKLAYVFDIANNKFKIYVNGSNVMDRNFGTYEIASPKMVKADFENANIYIGGGMANNASYENCDGTVHSVSVYDGALSEREIYLLTATIDEDEVTSYEQLESGKVYTFESQRGWLMAASGTDFVYNSAKLTNANASKGNANCQWVLYSTDKGKYLYNVGVDKFISVNKSNANSIPLSAAPTTAAVEFKASTLNAYPIIVGIENYAINHNTNNDTFTYGALLWKDGWTQDTWLNDAGSCHKVRLVGDADKNILAAIEQHVGVFESKYELAAAITNAETFFGQRAIGTGVGEYSGYFKTAAQVESFFTSVTTFYNNINFETNVANIIGYIDLINDEIIPSFQLNMPVAGKYYTFKNGESYITSGVTSGGRIAMSATKDATSVYYYDGSHLLAYTTGLYFGLNGTDWTFETIGSDDISKIDFVAAANGALARYNIKSGGRWLHKSTNNGVYINRCQNNTCGNDHNFVVEEVESLPVTISAAKYATFYAPVAVEVADGVTAYAVKINGNWATLTAIEGGVIPANTGVVLQGEAKAYDFVVTSTTATVDSDLAGTAAATYITDDAYVLTADANSEAGVCFGKATKNQQNNTSWLNNSHKAYLPVPANTEGVKYYSFRFGEGTTGVENIEVENASNVIYDLTGRRVETITAPGIYIVGGKKVLVK